ncbi:MAG: hypothetical protein ABIJ46_01920 [bacterium]
MADGHDWTEQELLAFRTWHDSQPFRNLRGRLILDERSGRMTIQMEYPFSPTPDASIRALRAQTTEDLEIVLNLLAEHLAEGKTSVVAEVVRALADESYLLPGETRPNDPPEQGR